MADDSEDADRTPDDAPASSAPESDAEQSEPEQTDAKPNGAETGTADSTSEQPSSGDEPIEVDSSAGDTDSDASPESADESRTGDESPATEGSPSDSTDDTEADSEQPDVSDGDSESGDEATTDANDETESVQAPRAEACEATAVDVEFGDIDPDVLAGTDDDSPADGESDPAADDDRTDEKPATEGLDPAPTGVDVTEAADAPAVDAGPETGGDVVTGTDGGASMGAGGAGEVGVNDPMIDDGIVSEGPESDEEMPLAAHIEEMIRRLAVVLGIGGLVTLLLYPGADLVNSAFGVDLVSSTQVIDFLWNKHIPGAPEMVDRRPRVYGPLELVLTELKVAALGGLVVGLPAFVYETYLFMRPGLYEKERRYYLAAVPTSLILAFIGISFAHFIVLPAIFAYFTSYTTGTALVAFGLKETFNLILILMGYNAIIFQIPLFVMLAIMMNLVTRQWMVDRRLLFWGTFLGLAFLVSPDPTGMAPIIIALTMIVLFEGTLLALRWTGTE
ncbi:MAG: twin-arginine translocase subunit TatC [Halobellus sp.]|uniref:twin-arginine translocase subunit TatC n=1 Tax=Halobellus sp. TaxID=1979212 RepID=UPI0035D4922F